MTINNWSKKALRGAVLSCKDSFCKMPKLERRLEALDPDGQAKNLRAAFLDMIFEGTDLDREDRNGFAFYLECRFTEEAFSSICEIQDDFRRRQDGPDRQP